MATRAAAENLAVVDAGNRAPGRFSVTVFTKNRAENVVHWYWRGLNQSSAGMTARTISRRSLENSTDMAGRTICKLMGAVQIKTG